MRLANNYAKRPHVRNGKRTRRALIRLRHVAAEKRFIRWAYRTNNLPPPELEGRPWRTPEWHQWHKLGCI
jgi:hypothetical protein